MEGVGDRETERSVMFAVTLSIAADTQRKCLLFEATRGKRRQGGEVISGISGRSYLIAEKTPDNGLAILFFCSIATCGRDKGRKRSVIWVVGHR
jgi:hypothetical protein